MVDYTVVVDQPGSAVVVDYTAVVAKPGRDVVVASDI